LPLKLSKSFAFESASHIIAEDRDMISSHLYHL